ncbi:hypothetical protein CsSME_00023652 [Camellia sinensis var. sinensis]
MPFKVVESKLRLLSETAFCLSAVQKYFNDFCSHYSWETINWVRQWQVSDASMIDSRWSVNDDDASLPV